MTGTVAAIVVAAGRGLRAGNEFPKQYRRIAGEPVVRMSLAMLAAHARVNLVQPVIHGEDQERFAAACAGLELLPAVAGGTTRQASVRAGLEALAQHRPEIVVVHDAARPFASAALVRRAVANASVHKAAVPALPVTDTVKKVDGAGHVLGTLERSELRIVQTPQAFHFDTLLDAHRRAAAQGRNDFTDDAALCEWAGQTVTLFEGEARNVKLTTAEDFARAEAMRLVALADVRTGNGFDVHAFGPGDHVMLGGVRVDHDRALSGHSDADVMLHALTDAILGALAEGDIGSHFPASDARWQGASSDQFLAFATERVRARHGLIAHLDVTLVCEVPRIGPHRDAMRASIARIANVSVDRVAVKATTSEGLGFTGRGEGIACYATATIRLPWSAS